MPAVVPQEITAHKFTLVDGNGKTRADLIMLKDGPSLSLYDENGKTRAELVALKDGSGLSLYDKNDKKRAELVALKDGSGLSLYDKNDKKRARLRLDEDRPSLNLSDENGKPRAMLEEDKNGASLILCTKNQTTIPTIILAAEEMSHPDMTGLPSGLSPDHVSYGSGLEVYDENSGVRAELTVNKDGADLTLGDRFPGHITTLYGGKGGTGLILNVGFKARAMLRVDKDGPALSLYDKNGKTLRSLP